MVAVVAIQVYRVGPPKSLVAVETAVPAELVISAGPAVLSALAVPFVLDHSALTGLVLVKRHVVGVEALRELAAHAANHALARTPDVTVKTDGIPWALEGLRTVLVLAVVVVP